MRKPNLVFMYGEDSFSLLQEVQRWKELFLEKHGDMNIEVLDNPELSNKEIAGSISAMPFLGEKRLVILKNFLSSNNADRQKELIPVLENLSDTTVLVIVETEAPDKRLSLFKNLSKNATERCFEKPKGAMLSTWIIRRVEANGGKMGHNAAAYLVGAYGDSLGAINNEAQKLSLFARGEVITPEMIDTLVTGSIQQSIFIMTDQLAQRNIAGALKTIRKLNEQGQGAPFLFSMIVRQFRLMLEMKALMEDRTPQGAIAGKMDVKPFVVQKTLSQCKNFTYSQLKRALKNLLDVDRRLKTGGLHLRQREEAQYLLAIERVLLNN